MIISRKQAEEAWRELNGTTALENLTLSILDSAYKRRARETHPDVGGSQEGFVKADQARRTLLAWLARGNGGGTRCTSSFAPPKCPVCSGRGYAMQQRAFRALRVMCPACRGTGEVGVEQEKEP